MSMLLHCDLNIIMSRFSKKNFMSMQWLHLPEGALPLPSIVFCLTSHLERYIYSCP